MWGFKVFCAPHTDAHTRRASALAWGDHPETRAGAEHAVARSERPALWVCTGPLPESLVGWAVGRRRKPLLGDSLSRNTLAEFAWRGAPSQPPAPHSLH